MSPRIGKEGLFSRGEYSRSDRMKLAQTISYQKMGVHSVRAEDRNGLIWGNASW
jgi:hypothetical protein